MIGYSDVQAYLNAIADNAALDVDGPACPHKRFWNITYQAFKTQSVPNIHASGAPFTVKIINDAAPAESPFYKILLAQLTLPNGASTVTFKRMPDGGPFVDAALSVTVNGVQISGDQILQNILAWLTGGMPEVAPVAPPVPPAPPVALDAQPFHLGVEPVDQPAPDKK